MTNFEKINIIANQLANAGKKPTVALIKAKLTSPIPLPQIIGALKGWQHEPDNCYFHENKTEEDLNEGQGEMLDEENLTLTQVARLIENAVSPLKAELNELKAQLEQLKK